MRRSVFALVALGAAGCGTTGMVGGPDEANGLIATAQTAYYRGDYATAESHFARARRLFDRYDDQQGAAYAWNNLGSVALRQREYDKAGGYFRRARETFLALQDDTGAAIATNNLGTALRSLGRLDDARRTHEAALDLATRAAAPIIQAAAHGGVGLVLLDDDEADSAALAEAERRFLLARDLQRKAGDELGQAATLGNLGALAAVRGNVPVAIEHYTAALEADRRLQNVGGIAQDLSALAELHVRADQLGEALPLAERALRVHEEIGDEVGVRRALALVREIEERLGQNLAGAETRPLAP